MGSVCPPGVELDKICRVYNGHCVRKTIYSVLSFATMLREFRSLYTDVVEQANEGHWDTRESRDGSHVLAEMEASFSRTT